MAIQLKPLSEQVVVITGASSGIGLATARLAAQHGARLVLAARSEHALRELEDELTGGGTQVEVVVADVSRLEDVRRIARQTHERFGGFDTWVNNAGAGMYGKLTDVTLENMRQVFDTNYWGLVYGSLEAVKTLRERGGALINIGSTASEHAIVLQGTYSASKHAVKAFTDALRMELQDDQAPISVTLIKPGAIDTPFPLNAKNYLGVLPQHVPPVYAPGTVARAVVRAAQTPTREVFVGAGGKALAALGDFAPGLMDRFEEKTTIPQTEASGRPPRPQGVNALERPSEQLRERGEYPGMVQKTSVYTAAVLRGVMPKLALLAAGATVAALWRSSRR